MKTDMIGELLRGRINISISIKTTEALALISVDGAENVQKLRMWRGSRELDVE